MRFIRDWCHWCQCWLVVLVVTGASGQSAAQPPAVVIGEFRLRGPNGGGDELIELFNASSSVVNIGGWKIKGSSATGAVAVRATLAAATVLPPGCRYLLANSGGPYSGAVAGDQTYTLGIADDGGIALTLPDDTVVDQVGMSPGSAFKEGAILAPLTLNQDRGYERRPGGAAGNGMDTNDNASDFLEVAPSGPQSSASTCFVATATPSMTAPSTSTPSPTVTETTVATVTATETATPTELPTDAPSASPTLSPTPTATDTFTASPTVSPTATASDVPTASPTSTLVATLSPTESPSATATPTESATGLPTATKTEVATASPTLTRSTTSTASAAATASPTVSPTSTAKRTAPPLPTHSLPPSANASATPTCTVVMEAQCGNGVLEDDEQCDDGNLVDGDACPAMCHFGKAGVLIRGNRRPAQANRDGCLAEWQVAAAALDIDRYGMPDFAQSCLDQDGSCDFDPTPDRCQFQVRLCFNNEDVHLAGCGTPAVERVEVLAPRSGGVGREQNRGAVLVALESLPRTSLSGQRNLCTLPFTVGVALGSRSLAREELLVRTFEAGAGAEHGRLSRLRLTCRASK